MDVLTIVISLFVVLFAITIHEASHAWSAAKLGDPTALSMGRVSLNPLAHIDPIGTVLLPLVLVLMKAPAFGWARPVPVNPLNFRNPRRDNLLISASGPAANLLAASFSLVLVIALKLLKPDTVSFLHSYLLGRGGASSGFHPLNGLILILFYAVLINTYLAVFNLIPIPPLDGSGILLGLLSPEAAQKYERIRPFSFILIIGLIYLGVLDLIVRPIQIFIYTIIFY
jgi:Zn-dependent protease